MTISLTTAISWSSLVWLTLTRLCLALGKPGVVPAGCCAGCLGGGACCGFSACCTGAGAGAGSGSLAVGAGAASGAGSGAGWAGSIGS